MKACLSALFVSLIVLIGVSAGFIPLRSAVNAQADSIEMTDLLDALLNSGSGSTGVFSNTVETFAPVAKAVQTYFSHDFESGLYPFSTTPLWGVSTFSSCLAGVTGNASAQALRYGNSKTCDYEDGTANGGMATSPVIDLTGVAAPVMLSFIYYLDTDGVMGSDIAEVQVRVDGSGTWTLIADNQGTMGAIPLLDPTASWQTVTLDLAGAGVFTPGTNTDIQVRFVFDTVTTTANTFLGFYVDDVAVTADAPPVSRGGGGGGGCFIATAAYGTPMGGEIDALRVLRDKHLLNNAIGTLFVDTYYRISPPIAGIVARHALAATAVRWLLTPLLALTLAILAVPELVGGTAVLMASVLMFRNVRNRES